MKNAHKELNYTPLQIQRENAIVGFYKKSLAIIDGKIEIALDQFYGNGGNDKAILLRVLMDVQEFIRGETNLND